jgi:ParB family chromosome partitioning protein
MTVKKKRLGRGLDALLSKSTASAPDTSDASARSGAAGDQLRNIPLEQLQRGQYQPRLDMRPESLQELAESIKAQGVVQPIVVRPLSPKGAQGQLYEIIAGERRWRAAQIAELDTIPAVVRHVADDAAIAMALIENIQRENLNPVEEARALERLIREFDVTHQEAATAVGRSRAAVSNLLRLLELSDKVKAMLETRQLEMGHARALLAITSPREQLDAARQVVAKQMSVRETERFVRRLQAGGGEAKAGAKSQPSADVRRLEQQLTDKLGARVRIEHSAKGPGKLVISYNSNEELDGILKHIK